MSKPTTYVAMGPVALEEKRSYERREERLQLAIAALLLTGTAILVPAMYADRKSLMVYPLCGTALLLVIASVLCIIPAEKARRRARSMEERTQVFTLTKPENIAQANKANRLATNIRRHPKYYEWAELKLWQVLTNLSACEADASYRVAMHDAQQAMQALLEKEAILNRRAP